MRQRQLAGVLALALLAGSAGIVAGSFFGGGPPPWLSAWMMRSDTGRDLAQRWLGASTPAMGARMGDPRPNPALLGLDGSPRGLSEWDGKLVLLNFWATWCGPCREEMPALDAVRRELADRGVEVIGIALDDADAVRAFLGATPVSYPILLAPADAPSAAVAFGDGNGVLPYTVLIGRDGRILEQHLGGLDKTALRAWLESKL